MNWKKFALVAALSGTTIGAVGCGGDGPGEPQTVTYVVSELTIPATSTTPGSMAAGFNLDDMVTSGEDLATCVTAAADFVSITDPSETGVDNALGGLVPVLNSFLDAPIDDTLATQIAEGSVLIMMQVRDVNSFTSDDSVELQLYLGEVPGGGAPMTAGATLAPGQTFTGTPIGAAVMGTIEGGRLRAETPSLTLAINQGDTMISLNIRNAQIGASISPTALVNGAIGGSLLVDDLVTIAEMVAPGMGETVRGFVEGVADLEPSADVEVCDSLSVGVLFGGVEAELGGS